MKTAHVDLLRNDLSEVITKYPELRIFSFNKVPYMLEGPIEIMDSDGNKRGVFDVQIFIPLGYPYSFPVIKEISNRIPKKVDRHINADGTCCLTVTQKQIIIARKGISILDFIILHTVPFLANQIYFEENGKWANGEYLHGILGQIQYYFEVFNTEDLEIVLKGIRKAIHEKTIGINNKSFCGNTKTLRECHLIAINEIKLINKEKLLVDLNTFENLLKT